MMNGITDGKRNGIIIIEREFRKKILQLVAEFNKDRISEEKTL
jgi:hypothetical protein